MATALPRRDQPIMINLSRTEKDNLVRAAQAADRPIGAMARKFINEKLATFDSEKARDDA